MDDLLNKSKDWTTTVDDCQRFNTNKRMEKDYLMPKWLVEAWVDNNSFIFN